MKDIIIPIKFTKRFQNISSKDFLEESSEEFVLRNGICGSIPRKILKRLAKDFGVIYEKIFKGIFRIVWEEGFNGSSRRNVRGISGCILTNFRKSPKVGSVELLEKKAFESFPDCLRILE